MTSQELVCQVYAACVDILYQGGGDLRPIHQLVDRESLLCPEQQRMQLHRVLLEFDQWLQGDGERWERIAVRAGCPGLIGRELIDACSAADSRRGSILALGPAYLDAEGELAARLGYAPGAENPDRKGITCAADLRALLAQLPEFADRPDQEQEDLHTYLYTLLLEHTTYYDPELPAAGGSPSGLFSGRMLAIDASVSLLQCVFRHYFDMP